MTFSLISSTFISWLSVVKKELYFLVCFVYYHYRFMNSDFSWFDAPIVLDFLQAGTYLLLCVFITFLLLLLLRKIHPEPTAVANLPLFFLFCLRKISPELTSVPISLYYKWVTATTWLMSVQVHTLDPNPWTQAVKVEGVYLTTTPWGQPKVHSLCWKVLWFSFYKGIVSCIHDHSIIKK